MSKDSIRSGKYDNSSSSWSSPRIRSVSGFNTRNRCSNATLAFVVRTPHNAAQPKRRLLNLRDVAAELDVSFDTVDRFLRAGRLPFVRLPSGRRRVDRSDLDAAIADWKAENR